MAKSAAVSVSRLQGDAGDRPVERDISKDFPYEICHRHTPLRHTEPCDLLPPLRRHHRTSSLRDRVSPHHLGHQSVDCGLEPLVLRLSRALAHPSVARPTTASPPTLRPPYAPPSTYYAPGRHRIPPSVPSSAAAPPPPEPPQTSVSPASPRWSLSNRFSTLNPFRLAFLSSQPSSPTAQPYQIPNRPYAPAARLWNPINSSPRAFAVPNVPVRHPTTLGASGDDFHGAGPASQRGEYPLLTRPEIQRDRPSQNHHQSGPGSSPGQPSSLVVERHPSNESGWISIGLPPEQQHQHHHQRRRSSTRGAPHTMAQLAARAAGIIDPAPEKDPITAVADADLEAGGPHAKPRRSASRASLPSGLSRQGSVRSSLRQNSVPDVHSPTSPHHAHHAPTTTGGTTDPTASVPTDAGDDADDDFAWGPAHPCFPHPNPHAPLHTPLHTRTRVVRVRRDWMASGDSAPAFANLYPEVLDPLVPEAAFRALVAHVNAELAQAFSPWRPRAWLDAVAGVATLWAWDDLGMTSVKRRLGRLEAWVEEWSRDVRAASGEVLVGVVPLRRTGYMTLDIQIPDPQIGVEAPEDEGPGDDAEQRQGPEDEQPEYDPHTTAGAAEPGSLADVHHEPVVATA